MPNLKLAFWHCCFLSPSIRGVHKCSGRWRLVRQTPLCVIALGLPPGVGGRWPQAIGIRRPPGVRRAGALEGKMPRVESERSLHGAAARGARGQPLALWALPGGPVSFEPARLNSLPGAPGGLPGFQVGDLGQCREQQMCSKSLTALVHHPVSPPCLHLTVCSISPCTI